MNKQWFLAAVACIVILCAPLAAEPPKTTADESSLSSDALADRVRIALDGERTDEAIRLLELGKLSYPDSSWFPETLGDLYSDKELYDLALREFLGAWKAGPGKSGIAYKTATTYGYLNREKDSIEWLERTIALDPENIDAIGDLGWMFFKVHRLEDGVKLLLDAGNTHGMNRAFAMTLGTLYAELYDYENSKRYYLDAIRDAERDSAKTFTAIAYYNLSLLEERWYRYPEALKLTDSSLAVHDRASGHLARGELFQQRQEFTQAFAEYQKAFSLDASPLSKINLADACVESGRLEEAERWIKQAKTHPNASWMLNFGTDSVQFQKDLDQIQKNLYSGLAEREGMRPKKNFVDAIVSFFKALVFRVLSWYHSELFRKHSETTARSYLRENNSLSAMANFYNAFEGHPGVAKKYLAEAEKLETSLVEKAKPGYALENALLEKSSTAIAEALLLLDPEWERDLVVQANAGLAEAEKARGRKAAAQGATRELYGVNRGALIRYGLKLPAIVRLAASQDADVAGFPRDVAGMIQSSFFERPALADPPFILELATGKNVMQARLVDGRGTELCSIPVPIAGTAHEDAFKASETIMREIFRAK